VFGFDTIIDSGTTLMYVFVVWFIGLVAEDHFRHGPPDAVKQFYDNVSGAQVFDSDQGFYSFPCDNIPEVSFNWDGQSVTVTPKK
jgi:cathepsin D